MVRVDRRFSSNGLRHTLVGLAVAGRLREPLEGSERGALLETLVFHELRAQIAYSGCGGEMAYYRTPSGSEVDFIWTRGSNSVGIEVKASERWRPEHGRALAELHRAKVVRACFGVLSPNVPLPMAIPRGRAIRLVH